MMMKSKNFCEFVKKHRLTIYLILVITISWSIWIPMTLDKFNIIDFRIPIIIGQSIGGFSPLLSLIILDVISGGSYNLKMIFSSIKFKKEGAIWLFLAAFTYPLLAITGNIINFLVGNEIQLNIFQPETLQLLGFGLIGIVPLLFFVSLFSSPLLEEPGWRGFTLGQLQRKFGRQLGSFLLGSFWWLWHQPINIVNGLKISIYSYISMVAYSFIIDSIFNLSKKNLLCAMFAHSSFAISTRFFMFTFIYQSTNWFVPLMFLIVIIILRIHEWKKSSISESLTNDQSLYSIDSIIRN